MNLLKVNTFTDKQENRWMDERTNECTEERMDGWMNEWMDGWMDEWMNQCWWNRLSRWKFTSDVDLLMMTIRWWWQYAGDDDLLVMTTCWWWRSAGDDDLLVMSICWWWRSAYDPSTMDFGVYKINKNFNLFFTWTPKYIFWLHNALMSWTRCQSGKKKSSVIPGRV